SSRRRHTRFSRDWSSDVCSSDLSMSADYFALLQAPAGSSAWSAEARAEYTQAPEDPRYRELAERILTERVPSDLRAFDAAKVFEIGRASRREMECATSIRKLVPW